MMDKPPMGDWKQEKPEWCPHQDCGFCARGQDSICIGKLPKSLDHDGVANTHRLCMRGAADDGLWLHEVEWNRGDAWNFRRIIDIAFAFDAGKLPTTDARQQASK